MIWVVVDTNVPVVANGRSTESSGRVHSTKCRKSCVDYLRNFKEKGYAVVLDSAREIESEYRRNLNPKEQARAGDRWYLDFVLRSPVSRKRVDLPKKADGQYESLPQTVIDAGFDPSDRKFAALAKQEGVPVANAVDGDWLDHREVLGDNGIRIDFVCGCDRDAWFEEEIRE